MQRAIKQFRILFTDTGSQKFPKIGALNVFQIYYQNWGITDKSKYVPLTHQHES